MPRHKAYGESRSPGKLRVLEKSISLTVYTAEKAITSRTRDLRAWSSGWASKASRPVDLAF